MVAYRFFNMPMTQFYLWASPWGYASCKDILFIPYGLIVVEWMLLQWLLHFVMCMLSVIPGIAGTQACHLSQKVGCYRMVSERSVACRIETLGLETLRIKSIFKCLQKYYLLYLSIHLFCSGIISSGSNFASFPFENCRCLPQICRWWMGMRRMC